jgi:hypothetical protein
MAGLVALVGLTAVNVAYGARAVKLLIRGEAAASDVPAQIVDGHTMVPLRIVAEQLNEEVRWDGKTGTVHVASDVWEQDLLDHLPRREWVRARNVILRLLVAFDERDESGRELVSEDFDTNLLAPEVVIPLPGVGGDTGTMVDFKFVDAKWDNENEELTVRVKIWSWSDYGDERKVKTWDFTLRREQGFKIRKVWQVDERELDGYRAFPGLKLGGGRK